jgi:hypothetical protein
VTNTDMSTTTSTQRSRSTHLRRPNSR